MNFEDIIDFEKNAYEKGYNDALHEIEEIEDIHMDSANTGILRGLKDGFKIGYHLGSALIETNKFPISKSVTPQMNRKNKIQKELIEFATKLGNMSLSDVSYSDCFEKNLELVRRINAKSSPNKILNYKSSHKDSLDF